MKSLSLFSGCLGLDLGLEQAGISAAAYVDKDPVCRETIRLNRPGVPVFEDVFDPRLPQFAKEQRINVIVGGPPCQSYSTMGRRRFLRDPRGRAVLGFLALVRAVEPQYFILEHGYPVVAGRPQGWYSDPAAQPLVAPLAGRGRPRR